MNFSFLVSAQLESLYICISLDYLMTLQDFFISGLPTSSEPRSRTATMTDDRKTSDQTDNRLKLSRPSTSIPKPSIPKRISFLQNIFLYSDSILV
jgi:hypothetical protein